MVLTISAAIAPNRSVVVNAFTAAAPFVLRHSWGNGSENCLHSAPRKLVSDSCCMASSYCYTIDHGYSKLVYVCQPFC